MLFCCYTQVQSSRNSENEALTDDPKLGAIFAVTFRPPKRCPPTVGGHRLGGRFLSQKRPPFWGRPLGGSKRGSVSWLQQFSITLVCRLPMIALFAHNHPSYFSDDGGDGFERDGVGRW